jgi:hypothetical protein
MAGVVCLVLCQMNTTALTNSKALRHMPIRSSFLNTCIFIVLGNMKRKLTWAQHSCMNQTNIHSCAREFVDEFYVYCFIYSPR